MRATANTAAIKYSKNSQPKSQAPVSMSAITHARISIAQYSTPA
jgi:hypothetical protein